MDLKEIMLAMERAKELGVAEFRAKGIYIRFDMNEKPKATESIPKASVPEMKADEIVKPESVLDQMSADEILYYASPYYDQLQAEKEAKQKGTVNHV